LKDLARDISLPMPVRPAFFQATMAACRGVGFSATIGQDALRDASALNLVAAGLGVCVVPSSIARMAMQGIVYRSLKGVGPLKESTSFRVVGMRLVVRNFLSAVNGTKGSLADEE
jgi:DNA-binding transcriptional LysR family regulator